MCPDGSLGTRHARREPDGSFVWVNPQADEASAPAWQIDGQLHDSAAGLMAIELKLTGARPDWQNVLRCVGWPQERVIFQLVQDGVFLDDAAWQDVLESLEFRDTSSD